MSAPTLDSTHVTAVVDPKDRDSEPTVADFESLQTTEALFAPYSSVPVSRGTKSQYPPHLDQSPGVDDDRNPFDPQATYDTYIIINNTIILRNAYYRFAPDSKATTMKDLDNHNALLRQTEGGRSKKTMYTNPNVGDREDWYTDAVFAQQQFTGVNPTTITLSTEWAKIFIEAAADESDDLRQLLSARAANQSLFVQDYSYFREAAGASEEADLVSEDGKKRLCAPVALFNLEDSGKLHPLAIIIDWKGSLLNSVTIFNRRLSSSDSKPQGQDWPWRFAKTCVNAADWTRHEIAIHLVNTHLVEEAIMVGATAKLPGTHPIITLLKPHWKVTFPVNDLARSMLVPSVITKLAGVTTTQVFNFLNHAYATFDFTGEYVPNDLKARGFPISEEELSAPKYHNYGYARNIVKTWQALRKFVSAVLSAHYGGEDKNVENDQRLQEFCQVMRTDVKMTTFPEHLKTLDAVIDMVTMCIHIATAQHSAINYLQEYYQVFVPNRPAAIYTSLPKSAQQLSQFTESNLFNALPVKSRQDWLLAAQLPHLLSFPSPDDVNIVTYALQESKSQDPVISHAATEFRKDLDRLGVELREISLSLDDRTARYRVLEPEFTASSIVI